MAILVTIKEFQGPNGIKISIPVNSSKIDLPGYGENEVVNAVFPIPLDQNGVDVIVVTNNKNDDAT